MLNSIFENYRKEYLQDMSDKHYLSNIKKDLKNNKEQDSFYAIDLLHFDPKKVIEILKDIWTNDDYNNCSNNFFYRGFAKTLIKDYEGALLDYDIALKYHCKPYMHGFYCSPTDDEEQIYREIEILHNRLYGTIDGAKKSLEYFTDILKLYKHKLIALKYRARANYYIDVEQAIKDYTELIEYTEDFMKGAGIVEISYYFARIKCNIKIWKTKNINKSKEIKEDLKKIYKELRDKISSRIYRRKDKLDKFIFIEEKIILNYLKSLFYELLNNKEKSKICRDKAKLYSKQHIFVHLCGYGSKKQIENRLQKNDFAQLVLNEASGYLLENYNIDLEYFKYLYTKWNIKITEKDLDDVLSYVDYCEGFDERVKFIIDNSDIDLNAWAGNRWNQTNFIISRACLSGAKLSFIKYLIEEKKVDYKKDKNILLSAIKGDENLEVIKYLIKTLKLPKQDKLLFEVCKESNLEIFKYLVEKCGYNPKIINENGETLLFEIVNDNFMDKEHIDILDYLICYCDLDLTIKNKDNKTFLGVVIENTIENKDFEILNYLKNKIIVKK